MKNTVLKIVFLGACMAFPLSAHAATKISDPAKFVADVYAHYTKVHDYAPPTDIYTPRLAALFALDTKEAGGEVGRIDFDPWTNSQDPDVSGVHVRAIPVFNVPSREIVEATFKQGGHPNTIDFYFEKIGGEWKLDDMHSGTGTEQPWTLSLILKYGWDNGQ